MQQRAHATYQSCPALIALCLPCPLPQALLRRVLGTAVELWQEEVGARLHAANFEALRRTFGAWQLLVIQREAERRQHILWNAAVAFREKQLLLAGLSAFVAAAAEARECARLLALRGPAFAMWRQLAATSRRHWDYEAARRVRRQWLLRQALAAWRASMEETAERWVGGWRPRTCMCHMLGDVVLVVQAHMLACLMLVGWLGSGCGGKWTGCCGGQSLAGGRQRGACVSAASNWRWQRHCDGWACSAGRWQPGGRQSGRSARSGCQLAWQRCTTTGSSWGRPGTRFELGGSRALAGRAALGGERPSKQQAWPALTRERRQGPADALKPQDLAGLAPSGPRPSSSTARQLPHSTSHSSK